MEFRCDLEKARSNERKHGVGFAEAFTVFADLDSRSWPDEDHSVDEQRWLTIGLSSSGRVLVVSHTDRDGVVRLISARRATRHEQKAYFER